MLRDINEVEFTIFDTETTGLNPAEGDRIVEIAGIRFKGKERISTFQSLINPERQISPAAYAVNKISSSMLIDAPKMDKVMPDFLNFIKGSCLCSYNAGFDLGFLNNELRLLGKSEIEDIIVVDILKMARRLLPKEERYALWFICQKLGINIKQEHRAFSDVEITLEVFQRLKDILESKGIIEFGNFSHLFGLNTQYLKSLKAQKLMEIQKAINLGLRIKIKYLSGSAQVSEREVIPKETKQEQGRDYLVGYCCLKNEERTFRIDGILHLQVV